ncbi:FHA domain-containing protein [Streptomyces cinerochromogenes]|uniref:FHA domain-containing protein n=1 Tax=Streptomyces cinerochromogenes TaxID=66422 RepID=UPI0033B78C81
MAGVRDWDDDDDWGGDDWGGEARTDDDTPDTEAAAAAAAEADAHVETDAEGADGGRADGDGDDDDEWGRVGRSRLLTRPASVPSPPSVGERCRDCGAVVPAGTAVCPACLTPVGAPRREAGTGRRPERLAGGALRLVFRSGGRHLVVPRGAELRLGRSSSWAPEASPLLAHEETVSGRHATVLHTADGAAWVTEVAQGATNGTRLNDRVLVPDRAERLRNGDRIELGPRVGFVVRGIEDEPAGPDG